MFIIFIGLIYSLTSITLISLIIFKMVNFDFFTTASLNLIFILPIF